MRNTNWSLILLLFLAAVCAGCFPDNGGPGTTTKTTPTITWPAPAAITYGTALSATQLDATASVAGSFVYTPAASTILNAGAQTLSVAFTPSDTSKYNSATGSVSITVNKATPTITWPAPAAITFGTALSAAQLNATASVPGTFVYVPPASTVLSAGAQTLSVTFTPTDSTNYGTATASVSITVNAAIGGVGPSGGTVNGFYGASVTVPAGALSTSVDIEIPRDSTGSPAMPSTGVESAGAMYALTPHGTPFSLPATVQIPFDSTRIPTDATPVIYKGEPGGSFAPIPTTINGNFLSADVSNFSWIIPGYAATLPRMVYALTRTDVNGTSTVSVSSFKITKDTGALSAATSSAPVGTGAISVTVHPSRRFLYVVNGSGFAQGAATNVPANSISVYQLDAVTGNITGPTNTQPINGNPVSVVVHPTGKFIYVVNEVRFGSDIGNLSAFSIDNVTGALTSMGTTADLGGEPATALAFAPSGEFAYVTYILGGPQNPSDFDTIKTYGVSPTSGLFTASPIGSAPTGDNPWALAVTPGGHFAYVASLSSQGNVAQLASYSINQTTGLLTLQNSFTISPATGQSPLSLAMDPEARFLYVGLQSLVFASPSSNFNVHTYAINPNNGSLSFAAGLATSSNPQGPISVVAEPQAQFLYVMDANNQLGAFKIVSNGSLTPQGSAIGNVFLGGATGGVGDPFFFAASGTSPVWQDNCTTMVSGPYIVFDGCPTTLLSTGPGSTGPGGTGSGNPPPPASQFTLNASTDIPGATIVSSPPGIDIDPINGQDFVEAGFPNGSVVSLTAGPPDHLNVYDVKWTGACSGTALTAFVTMAHDQSCSVTFTLASQR